MTKVRGVQRLVTSGAPDGFRAEMSLKDANGVLRTFEFRRATLPAAIRRATAADIERHINNELAGALAGEATQCKVRVYTASPLDVEAVCSDQPILPEHFDKVEG